MTYQEYMQYPVDNTYNRESEKERERERERERECVYCVNKNVKI